MSGPSAGQIASGTGKLLQGAAGFQAGKTNAKLARREAQGTLSAGVAQEADIRLQARRAAGEAITMMAANGGGLGEGSALTMLREVELESGLDRLRVRTAAQNRAAGLEVEAQLAKKRGIFDLATGVIDAAGSAFGGGGG